MSVPDAADLQGRELTEQARAIDEACGRRGWRVVELVREVEPARGKPLERPTLRYALGRIASGHASCLVVSELGRLGRSVADLGEVLGELARMRLRLLAVHPGIDTASESGRLAAEALASVSDSERKRLSQRTRKGLEAARARGAASRPSVEDRPELKRWIRSMRASGMTLQAIAGVLDEQGVPTLRGGAEWRPSSVQAALGYRRPARKSSVPNDPNGEQPPKGRDSV